MNAIRAVDCVIDEVAELFGLVARDGWRSCIERALEEADPTTVTAITSNKAARQAFVHRVVDELTINETYFLRHPTHFTAIAEHASALQAEGRPMRVWCAGCATGEEPYSVAIGIAQASGSWALSQVEVIGTDLSGAAVRRARQATYGRWSFRDAPEWLVPRYFTPADVSTWRVRVESLPCSFRFDVGCTRALAEAMETASVDVVMFRNVGIYLHSEFTRAIHAEVARILRPGGLLFVAPGDPRPGRPFVSIEDGSTSGYRTAPPVAEAPVTPIRPLPTPPRPRRAPPAARRPTPQPGPPADHGALQSARSLADVGQLDQALAALAGAPSEDLEASILRGQIHLARGEGESAVQELRRVTARAPQHWIARHWYALALESVGRGEQARVQARAVRAAIERGGPALAEDGVTTRDELLAAVAWLEERLT